MKAEKFPNDDHSKFASPDYREEKKSKKLKALESDELILKAVKSVLKNKPEINADEISVKVNEGIVLLEGNVDSLKTKRKIDKCLTDLGHIEVRNNVVSYQDNEHYKGPHEATYIDLGLGSYEKK